MPQSINTLVAVDIGNSRIKVGRFDRPISTAELSVPSATLELPLENREGDFELVRLESWCESHLALDAEWLISTVHSGAAVRLIGKVKRLAHQFDRQWLLHHVTNDEVPLAIEVAVPELVGTDRLMAALAANRLRAPDRAAIVVDLGTAIKVDLVTAEGAFAGGAILPGIAMSARALEEQTDALPRIAVEHWHQPPAPLGKATEPAIEAGIFWGAVGAVGELVGQYSKDLAPPPHVFVTGGGSQLVADVLATDKSLAVRHVPHLVLSGIALVDAAGE